MAKKEKTEDLVTLEMTEEQKDKVTAFLLKEEKEAEKAKEEAASNEGWMNIHLFTKHSFGRQTYGPGVARVPAGLAGQIIYQDQKAQGREIALNTSNKRLIEVMRSGQRIERTK